MAVIRQLSFKTWTASRRRPLLSDDSKRIDQESEIPVPMRHFLSSHQWIDMNAGLHRGGPSLDRLGVRRRVGVLDLIALVGCLIAIGGNPAKVAADDHWLIIGGGYAPEGNQASLERNVLAAQQRLALQNSGVKSSWIFFADGTSPGHDVQVIDRQSVPMANQLMAEFLSDSTDLGLHYRDHRIDGVRGAATPQNLQRWFSVEGRQLSAGDRLVIYVTAHGYASRGNRDSYDTSIATWNKTSVTTKQFDQWLNTLPQGVDVVLVMVQCYSGGFARLIFDPTDSDQQPTAQRRIGVFATVHDRPAAGCTADVDQADYREYSTSFFEALDQTRDQERSGPAPADFDDDGKISIAEAHAWTVLHSDTIDLPVITSGEYLTVHSRLAESGDPDLLGDAVPYSQIVQLAGPVQRAVLDGLSEQLGLTGEDRVQQADRQTRRGRRRRSGTSDGRWLSIQRRIGDSLKERWPGLANVLNPIATELLTRRSDEFIAAVKQHPDYARYQQLKDEQENQLSSAERSVKYERFIRTADNVVLAENLRRMHDGQLWRDYQNLVEQESRPLFGF
ncbi:hypothetical protein Pan14r_26890 [Crateriforma conspicua]|uniref:Caspase domain protein n=2 Tax=Crateriforma conspicua TaxID=2527996 RepID=A0A5C5Y6L3_9PLAN|nr:hypothetical protein Pan14r_26890 [Crateriforma conspicua]